MEPTTDARQAVLEKYRKGILQVYTGNGKGKTTAAFGQALRAIGQGYKVCVIQFMKGRKYGEFLAAEKYLPDLTVHLSGLDSFVMRDNPAPLDIELARQGLDLARQAVLSGDYDMVILDEINAAADFKLIPLADVLALMKDKPAGLDLILTG
ncbi:MAG: cob(I)yrinic acid a,c-diamide adenosyltransferase, partial [Proteobacteria bacterium]|nr:cob(I)yrinic acid a,c-diamide adenosyltransferase [Pseudomonadota bacterium]